MGGEQRIGTKAASAPSQEVAMPISARLQELLEQHDVEYEAIHHPQDFRAQLTARDTHTPPEEFAKAVVVHVDGGYAMALLPATHYLAPARLARSIGAYEVRLASETEMASRIPGYEIGAAPPFPSLCGLRVYASPLLASEKHITFNAGTHRDAVRMSWADYERLAKPEVVHLSHHEDEAEQED
jgi:Ala-tRNA(Pro) deacylase